MSKLQALALWLRHGDQFGGMVDKEPVEYPVLSQKLIVLLLMTNNLCLEHCIILILFSCLFHQDF